MNKLKSELERQLHDYDKSELFKVKDNSYSLDVNLKHGYPGGVVSVKSDDFVIIGEVNIPTSNGICGVIFLDTAIQNVGTEEIHYVNRKISLIEKDKYRFVPRKAMHVYITT